MRNALPIRLLRVLGLAFSAAAVCSGQEPGPAKGLADDPRLQIRALLTTGSKVVDHEAQTGDDNGGIAVSHSKVFINGDSSAASLDLVTLRSATSLGRIYDGLCSDLGTGSVYTLASSGVPFARGRNSINELLELDPDAGTLTGLSIPLSRSVPLVDGCGVFSGNGRVLIHNRSEVYEISTRSGGVANLGAMDLPRWFQSENWAIWGVAEFFGGSFHLAYRERGSQRIVRSRVPDGELSTIATFTDLDDLASWTISPLLNRWYFHNEGRSQFGGISSNLSETVGFADAVIDFSAPPEPPEFPGVLEARGVTGRNFQYSIMATNSPTSFDATGLPPGLSIDTATGEISGVPTTAGTTQVDVSATNDQGTAMGQLTLTVIGIPEFEELEIVSLDATGSRIVDHEPLTGDDRGGIAVSARKVFVTGTDSSAMFDLTTLGGGVSLGSVYDGLCSDLGSGKVYTLAFDGTPHTSEAVTINELLELDPITGALTGSSIPLTDPIPITFALGNGVFSGNGRVVIHDGSFVYDILIPSGVVFERGAMPRPSWRVSENWAMWGVAEYFAGDLYITYHEVQNRMVRQRVPDGTPELIREFTSLGNIASWTVSPVTQRWYFYNEGTTQFGSSRQNVGYADATIKFGPPSAPPDIRSPLEFPGVRTLDFRYEIKASGSPTSFTAIGLPTGLTLDPATGLISGVPSETGSFTVAIAVTNDAGTTTADLILNVYELPVAPDLKIEHLGSTNAQLINAFTLTGDDRAGIAVSTDEVLLTGDVSTASYDLSDLGGGVSLGTRFDGICSDLGTGTVYTLAFEGAPYTREDVVANELLEIDPLTGRLGNLIPLSIPVTLAPDTGVFSGNGRIVVHTGTEVFDIFVPSGVVLEKGPMQRPRWQEGEGGPAWGVAEFFSDTLYLTHRADGNSSIVRARVPDGATETVESFVNLADLASWTVSPLTNRWYFAFEGMSQFGGSIVHLGSADAIVTLGAALSQPTIVGLLIARTTVNQEFSYEIRATGSPSSYDATGLPQGLIVDPRTGVISGQATVAGEYTVTISATNELGTGTETLNLSVLEIPRTGILQIEYLGTTGSRIVQIDGQAGDDRGGIAVSPSRVFVTGDDATARYDLATLGGGQTLGPTYDGLCSDLGRGRVYVLAFEGVPFVQGGSEIDGLLELDPRTGAPTGTSILLTETIPVSDNSGIFNGNGQIVIHNGTTVFQVFVPSGVVVERGQMARPRWFRTESWAVWGVAEYFADQLYLTYRHLIGHTIVRTRFSDGHTETVADFHDLGELANWTVSTETNRWYFSHENTSQFGGSSEIIGYADAVVNLGLPTGRPTFVGPLDPKTLQGRSFRWQLRAAGVPMSFGAVDLPPGITIDPETGVISGLPTDPGVYPITITATNSVGSARTTLTLTVVEGPPSQHLRILSLGTTGSRVVDHQPLTGDDREGMAITTSRLFVNGQSAAAAFRANDLGGGFALPRQLDGLCSDLGDGSLFTLAFNGSPFDANRASINQLLELDPRTGAVSGRVISLSQSIPTDELSGVFSGNGRIVLHSGARVYDIIIDGGTVFDLGMMRAPNWTNSSTRTCWGVAEVFGGDLYLAYRQIDRNSIERIRVPDGFTEEIEAFGDLSDLSNWTISPSGDRWYYHYEGAGQFGGSDETTGYADAEVEIGPPTELPNFFGSLQMEVLGGRDFRFQPDVSGAPTSFEASGLPPGLTIEPASGIISGQSTAPGVYSVSLMATNTIGTSTETLTLIVLRVPPSRHLRIQSLGSTGGRVVNHDSDTGDDNGGIAISGSRVIVNGDARAVSFDLPTLGDAASLGRKYDGLCSDLVTGAVFTLAHSGVPYARGGRSINELLEIDPISGALTGRRLPLTQTIPLARDPQVRPHAGVFSGNGRVLIHNGTHVYDISLHFGTVAQRGGMIAPDWEETENWAVWGVAEFFGGTLHLAYREAGGSSIVRSRVPDGRMQTIADFTNLGELANWTVSPFTDRWYFHHEGESQFGDAPEAVGYADALVEFGPSNAAPVAIADQYEIVEDSMLRLDRESGVLINDTDADDGNGLEILSATLFSPPSHGEVDFAADGSFVYTPDLDFFGVDSFTYTASEGIDDSEPGEVTIRVIEMVDLELESDRDREVVGAPGSVTHTVTVLNHGPSDATSAMIALESIFPTGVSFEVPTVSRGSVARDQWMFDLAENQSASLEITYQADASAEGGIDVLTTRATVNGLDQPTTNSADATTVSTSLISPADTGVIEVDAAPQLDLQSGLFTQQVTITNNNPLPLAGFRLVINNLPTDAQGYNAHGNTGSGSPFIDSNQKLASGASTTLTLEFFRPSLDANFTPAFSIGAVFADDKPAPAVADGGAKIDNLVTLDNGEFLIEFASTPGVDYAIEYTHDLQEWHRVVPSITANATRTQWIDAGPPKTISHPSSVPSRCYRIVTPTN